MILREAPTSQRAALENGSIIGPLDRRNARERNLLSLGMQDLFLSVTSGQTEGLPIRNGKLWGGDGLVCCKAAFRTQFIEPRGTSTPRVRASTRTRWGGPNSRHGATVGLLTRWWCYVHVLLIDTLQDSYLGRFLREAESELKGASRGRKAQPRFFKAPAVRHLQGNLLRLCALGVEALKAVAPALEKRSQ